MSPYFPNTTEAGVYFCPNCKQWFRRSSLSCCVAHGPGTCCHQYEQVATPPSTTHARNVQPGDWRVK